MERWPQLRVRMSSQVGRALLWGWGHRTFTPTTALVLGADGPLGWDPDGILASEVPRSVAPQGLSGPAVGETGVLSQWAPLPWLLSLFPFWELGPPGGQADCRVGPVPVG